MAGFSFRLRFRIPPGELLGIEEHEVSFAWDSGRSVVLKAYDDAQHIKGAEWLVLKCDGWSTEQEAADGAEIVMDALRIALARLNFAADLGRRASRSFVFNAFLDAMSKQAERPVLDDAHGPMVYLTEPRPMFAKAGQVTYSRTWQAERWGDVFSYCLQCKHVLSERERTAFDLMASARDVARSEDARFVLLFAAIEVLLEDVPGSAELIGHVDRLIALTKATEFNDVDDNEKNSLVGSLKWLRKHSIRRRGRDYVARRLGSRQYNEKPAETFFLDCYDMRNRLVHGQLPFSGRREVATLAGPLQLMVSHLIAGPALNVEL